MSSSNNEESKSVIYYNTGKRCLIRLIISIFSLRKFWDGKVTIIQEGELVGWVEKAVTRMNVDIIYIPEDDHRDGRSALSQKPKLQRYSPYEKNLFFDSDTVVVGPIDEMFEQLDKHEFIVTHFADWVTKGNRMAKRIKSFEPVIGKKEVQGALNYGKGINTGIFAWRKGAAIFPEWERVTAEGYDKNCTRRMVDEVACQVLLHKYPHGIVDSNWNSSVRFGPFVPKSEDEPHDVKVVHFHGNKHCNDQKQSWVWEKLYWEYRNKSRFYNHMKDANGDRRYKRYLSEHSLKDLTVVTAVNPKYIKKFLRNIPKWMKMKGLREQQFIVFYKDLDFTDKQYKSVTNYKNIKFIEWKPVEHDGMIEREKMLSAFVFGTAEHVNTKYWMKLDCDVAPKVDKFDWPDYHNHDVIAHKWGYTKMKGDSNVEYHWLNRLDNWWGGENYFDKIYCPDKDKRVGHQRIASFCCIERTDTTKFIANKCVNNRLPIPSQDTLLWYVATRLGKKIKRMNMKKYFNPRG